MQNVKFFLGLLIFVSTSALASSEENLKACLLKVCGPADDVSNPVKQLKVYEESPSSFDSTIQNQIFPLISEAVKSKKKADQAMQKALIKHQREFLSRNPSSDSLLFVNFLKGLKLLSEYVNFFKFENSPYKFDESKRGELLKTKDPKTLDTEISIASILLNSNFFKEYLFSLSLKSFAFYDYMYPGIPLDQALRKDIAELDKKIEFIVRKFPALKSSLLKNIEYAVLKTNGNFTSEASAKRFFSTRLTITAFYDYLEIDDFKTIREMQTKVSDLVTVDSYFTTLREYQVRTNSKFTASKIELTKDFCFSSLRRALNSSPSELDKLAMIKKLKSVKSEALKLSSVFNISDKDFAKNVEAINFFFPNSPAQIIKGTIEFLKNSIDSDKEDIREISQSSISDDRLYLNMFSILSGKTSSIDASENSIASFCESLNPSESPADFSLRTTGSISTSWQTFFYNTIGTSIIAHETGHSVEKLIDIFSIAENLSNNQKPSNQFNVVRTCISDMHPYAKDKRYFSEDFADAFAAKITLNKSANFGCMFLPKTKNDDYNYSGIKLKHPDNYNDPHSTALFRALHFYSYINPLPKECADYVKAESDIEFKQCL